MYQERIDKLNAYDRGELLRDGKDISFNDVAREIDMLIAFFGGLYSNNTVQNSFRNEELKSLDSDYERVTRVLDEIVTTPDWGSVDRARIDDIKNTLRSEFNSIIGSNYLTRLQAAIAFGMQTSSELEEQREATKAFLSQIRTQVKQAEKYVKQTSESAQKSVEDLAQKIESSNGRMFAKRAEIHSKAAKWWLGVLVVAVTAYVVVAAVVMQHLLDVKLTEVNGVSAIFKLAALLGGLYLISILNRNYSANKHLEVVNNHRANIFAIINELVDAQKDDGNRQLLLAYGAKVIFDMEESGYLTRNYGAGQGGDDIAGFLLDKFSGKKSGS